MEWSTCRRCASGLFGLLLLALAPAADAVPIRDVWLTANGLGVPWETPSRWGSDIAAGLTPLTAPPTAGDVVHVTSHDTLAIWGTVLSVPWPADVHAASPEPIAGLFVGGWEATHDATLETDPVRHFGTLTGGATIEETAPGVCGAVHVGHRGATGYLIQQRTMTSTTSRVLSICEDSTAPGRLVLGFGGKTSRAYHMVKSGAYPASKSWVDASTVDVGGQGFGFLRLRGGEFRQTCTAPGGCESHVGRGHGAAATGYIPATGVTDVSEGLVRANSVTVGSEIGSSGVIHVSSGHDPGDGTQHSRLIVPETLTLGREGNGGLVLMGGLVRTGRIVLAEEDGATGSLTLRGGFLEQEGNTLGVWNGAPGGTGVITVIGDDTVITLQGDYFQADGSQLIGVVVEAGGISTIAVDGAADFSADAIVDVQIANENALHTPIRDLDPETSFTLVQAGSITGAGPKLSVRARADWKLVVGTTEIEIIYCKDVWDDPSHPSCQGS